MNCTHARQLMMDRLYETLPLQESIALETHLLSCADCSLEWSAVQHSHTFMRRLPMEEPSPSIQSAVLALKFDPIPQTHTGHLWKYTAYAAVFMALLFSSLQFIQQNPLNISKAEPNRINLPSNTDDTDFLSNRLDQIHPSHVIASAPIAPETERENSEIPSTFQLNTLSLSSAPQPESKTSSTFATYEKSTAKTSDKDAEEVFRSGLKNYNEAFTHVGQEKESLLRGAIVFLQKMEKQYPDQKQWLAMSFILIADAHRELGETPKSIAAYRRMIEHFPDLEPYCQEARASMFQLCINPGDDLPQAETVLIDYEKHYPKTEEFAELAIAYAEKIQDDKPKEALAWANKAAEIFPEGHPLEAKTFTLMDELEVKIADQFAIKDWLILGPLPVTAQPFLSEINYLPPNRQQIFAGADGKINWIHSTDLNPFNIHKAIPGIQSNHCAIAVTYIQSPETRLAFLDYPLFPCRVWINGNPIWGGTTAQAQDGRLKTTRSEPGIKLTLKEGWNELVLKVQGQVSHGSRFSLYSDKGNRLTDLKVDPNQGSRNQIEKKAVFRRR